MRQGESFILFFQEELHQHTGLAVWLVHVFSAEVL